MEMNYEIVRLTKMKAAGLKVRTNNASPDMQMKIGSLWQRFYEEGIPSSLKERANEASIGLYTGYEGDYRGDYDFYACCQVLPEAKLPKHVEAVEIHEGIYAKFVVKGHMQKAVGEFWDKLWEMSLKRKYDCDFEEYQPGSDMENCEIHIYISLEEE